MFQFMTRLFDRVFGPRPVRTVRAPFPRQTLVVLHRHYMAIACRHQERRNNQRLARTLELR
jgi:hypothetical protein